MMIFIYSVQICSVLRPQENMEIFEYFKPKVYVKIIKSLFKVLNNY